MQIGSELLHTHLMENTLFLGLMMKHSEYGIAPLASKLVLHWKAIQIGSKLLLTLLMGSILFSGLVIKH